MNKPVRKPISPRTLPGKKPKAAASTPSGSEFPMRINKYLAREGHATRRDADTLVEKGLVIINGRRATLGDKVFASDKVEVRFRQPKTFVYVAFNKPAGMDTHQEDTGTKNVLDSLPADLKRLKLFPLGRLDKASEGLLLLTNDGRLTDRLLNPKYDHEKTYEVTTKEPLRSNFKERMEAGVVIEGYKTRPAKVSVLGDKRFRVTLTEGKTHQIRRMVVALFNEVVGLKRTSIGHIQLDTLPKGGYRVLEGIERDQLLKAVGLLA